MSTKYCHKQSTLRSPGVLITLKSLLAALRVDYIDFNVYIRHLYVYSDICDLYSLHWSKELDTQWSYLF